MWKILSSFLLVSNICFGADYFVDVTSGSDANNGTSQGSPWAHVPGSIGISAGAGWTTLHGGDSLTVKGGTTNYYQVQFTPVYYAGAAAYDSITVRSGHLLGTPWGTGPAIFDEGLTNTYGFWFSGNSGGNLNGLTVDGFEIRNVGAGGVGNGFDTSRGSCCVALGGNYASAFSTVIHCYLHHASRSVDDTGHGIETSAPQDTRILCNTIGPCIGTKGIEPYAALRILISSNYFTGSGDHEIALSATTNADVCNNIIYNTAANTWTGTNAHDPYGSITIGGEHCDIWNNLLFAAVDRSAPNNNWSSGFLMYGSTTKTNLNNNRICFNTVYGFSATNKTYARNGSFCCGANATDIITNTLVSHNLFIGGNLSGKFINSAFFRASSSGTFEYNNLFSSSTGETNVISTDSTGVPYNYYAIGNAIVPGFTLTGNLNVNPMFKGGSYPIGIDANYRPDSDYFRLTDSSPLSVRVTSSPVYGIPGQGFSTNSDKFLYDIFGSRRVAWSIGAVESYTSASINSMLPASITYPHGSQKFNCSISPGSLSVTNVSWYVNGTLVKTGTNTTYWMNPGSYTVDCVITDSGNVSVTNSSSVTIVPIGKYYPLKRKLI